MRPMIEAFNDLYINGADMGTSITSSTIKIGTIASFAIQFIWSGASSPIGVVALQGSNDDVTYTAMSDTNASISGASGSVLINVEIPAYKYVQVTYTRTSGSGGTVTCRAHGKQ